MEIRIFTDETYETAFYKQKSFHPINVTMYILFLTFYTFLQIMRVPSVFKILVNA